MHEKVKKNFFFTKGFLKTEKKCGKVLKKCGTSGKQVGEKCGKSVKNVWKRCRKSLKKMCEQVWKKYWKSM